MKFLLLLSFLATLFANLLAQTYQLTDNMAISSNSIIKILGGSYVIKDVGNDGLIQINNAENVVIDGDSVDVDGQSYSGYLIKISNSSNIIIKNFSSGTHFKYGVYVTNSKNIEVSNCNFSYNKVDSAGWIDVWSGYTAALGGGAMFYSCDSVRVHNCIMKLQNDGVALYNSKHAEVDSNDFAWNTSYGIRMYFTDSSLIHDNVASHVNRPYTDPSDCAALLMIVSNENTVERNDLSYSGDGVFLGQYQHSSVPNNNYFAYNLCSGSPHNAIEATFADGNIYKHNICNYSEYGFWLGYSFNSIIDSNEIHYNQYSGMSIDRGYNNVIRSNTFVANPIGIELWEGNPPASGYENQTSHDYLIESNTFSGNTQAISASATENMSIVNDSFLKNYSGVLFDGISSDEQLAGNYFDVSVIYDIQNNSTYDIDADSNTFIYCDSDFIQDKIYDELDNAGKGSVDITPYNCNTTPIYETEVPFDLAEPPALWYPYPESCWWLGIPEPLTVTWDSTIKHDGAASAHLNTGTGWYIDMSYRPEGNKISKWDVSGFTYLSFWIYSVDTNPGAFQYYHVRIGNSSGGYFRYNSSGGSLNQSLNNWKNYLVPLNGGTGWTKQTIGDVSLSDINYVEVWTDTYGVGYDLWLDGVQFTEPTGISQINSDHMGVTVFPNPFSDQTTITFQAAEPGSAMVIIIDLQGKAIREILQDYNQAGEQHIVVSKRDMFPGIYFYWIYSGDKSYKGKLVVQ